jgi:hypothetical protein
MCVGIARASRRFPFAIERCYTPAAAASSGTADCENVLSPVVRLCVSPFVSRVLFFVLVPRAVTSRAGPPVDGHARETH